MEGKLSKLQFQREPYLTRDFCSQHGLLSTCPCMQGALERLCNLCLGDCILPSHTWVEADLGDCLQMASLPLGQWGLIAEGTLQAQAMNTSIIHSMRDTSVLKLNSDCQGRIADLYGQINSIISDNVLKKTHFWGTESAWSKIITSYVYMQIQLLSNSADS